MAHELDLSEIQEKAKKDERAIVDEGEIKFDVEDMIPRIVLFCEAISGVKFYPYQVEYASGIIESLLRNDGEELTALFSRQSGKSETNACVVAGCMVILPLLAKLFPKYAPLQNYAHGIYVGIFAPSGDQAGTTFSRVKTRIMSKNAELILADDDIALELKTVNNLVALTNGSFVTAMSASKNANIESKTYHLMIIEEAQDVDNRVVRKSIHPMGASTNATIIKVGTANDRKSDFYEAIRRNRRRTLEGKKKYHFQNDYKLVQKYNSRYAQFIKKEKERLGDSSDEFRMAYSCEFILERGMFLTEEKFNELMALNPGLELRITQGATSSQVAGIDWAKRYDSTIVTVLDVDWTAPIDIDEQSGVKHYKTRPLDWLELNGDDYESQFYQIVEFLAQFHIVTICSDATGVGDGMVDRLTAYYDGDVEVIGVTFTTQSKSMMYGYLAQEIIGNRLEIPNGSRVERHKKWQKFKSQLLDLEKSWRGKYMVCQHPNEKGAHDDYPDSLALAMMASREQGMPDVEVEESHLYDVGHKYKPEYHGRKDLFAPVEKKVEPEAKGYKVHKNRGSATGDSI